MWYPHQQIDNNFFFRYKLIILDEENEKNKLKNLHHDYRDNFMER